MMRFSTLIKNPAQWMAGKDNDHRVVVSNRVRLARNLAAAPFPGWAKPNARKQVLERILPVVEGLPEMKNAFSKHLDNLSGLEKRVLVERHLISREHAGNSSGSALVVNRNQSLSMMINEEDHLRMQAISPGFDLQPAYKMLNAVDNTLEGTLEYAFDPKLGFLTSCPSNLGTGMRASVMLHLPGLVISEQIGKVINGVNRIGLAVRGLFGEGSEAQANLFQVSNQSTLGESETDILTRLERIIEKIIGQEMNAREKLIEEKPTLVQDQVGRAYAVLRYAYVMSSKEALNQLSLLRFGLDCGFFQEAIPDPMDLLLMEIQPAHLQLRAGEKLSPEERDTFRAEILRKKLQLLPEPDIQCGDASLRDSLRASKRQTHPQSPTPSDDE